MRVKAIIAVVSWCLFFLMVISYRLGGVSTYTKCCRAGDQLDVCGSLNCVECDSRDQLVLYDNYTGSYQSFEHGNSAFFHETSNATTLSIRQACAVESLAFHNARLKIHLLMTNRVNWSHPVIKALRSYTNVRITAINLDNYFLDTALEQWYFCSRWRNGQFAVSHLSDALRFLTLWKYGGYYFDLDFVMLKPMAGYRNFIGAESELFLGAGALHVDYRHPLMQLAVQEFRDHYRRNYWGYNGPELITRVLKRWCRSSTMSELSNCRQFTVFPPEIFYPIAWSQWSRLFSEQVSSPYSLSQAIGAHVWNNLSKQQPVLKNSAQIYAQLIKNNCPSVFAIADDVF